MKYMITEKLLLFWQASIAAATAAADSDHPFIRRAQAHQPLPQLPQCGNPPCWCDLNAPSSTSSVCPAYPSGSIYLDKPLVADFFSSLVLKNSDYPDLQLCSPDLSNSVNLQDKSVNPYILCDEDILVESSNSKASKSSNVPKCLKSCGSRNHGPQAVCGITFRSNGVMIKPSNYNTDCNSEKADSYKVKTFPNDNKRKKSGYFMLHEGACGVCSTAQDMASYMRYSFPNPTSQIPTIDTMSFMCQNAVTSSQPNIAAKELVDRVSLCLQNGITQVVHPAGLSKNCAYAWAVNVFLTGLPETVGGCNTVCTTMLNKILDRTCLPDTINMCPYNPINCALHDCLRCDDSVSGSQFVQLSGMTRRNLGLHTLLPRPCGSLVNVTQTCVASN